MALPAIAFPGTLLGPTSKYHPGPGTHIHNSQIYASIAGSVTSSPPASQDTSSTTPSALKSSITATKPLPHLSIARPEPQPSPTTLGLLGPNLTSGPSLLPTVSSIVLARITRLGPRFATASILTVSNTVCTSAFQGLIRREDIRATEKDKVLIADSFRVGDVVRGEVISLGDQSNYYLSTARNELGVVMAESEDGNRMWPVSWKEFVDPRTNKREARKVAKPF